MIATSLLAGVTYLVLFNYNFKLCFSLEATIPYSCKCHVTCTISLYFSSSENGSPKLDIRMYF